MATAKKKGGAASLASPDFSIFKNIKTGDRWADAHVEHPDYGCFDTGSYALNALASGSIFGGFPRNQFIMACGKKGTGKSFLAKNNFARRLMDENYYIFHYDTEGETTEKKLEEENGYDPQKFTLIKEPTTVKMFFESINGIICQFEEMRGDALDCPYRAAFVLDSQGQLSTEKAIADASKGEAGKQDFTKAKELTATYRSITNRCALLGFPMFVTNHVYLNPNVKFGNPETVAGGESAQFSASIIFSMFKTYEKVGTDKEVKGVILKATVLKSRMVRDKLSASIYLDYEHGLNRYYGLHDWAINAGLVVDYDAKTFPNLEKPVDPATGKKVRVDCYVIKDPKKDPSEWIVCPKTRIDRAAYIGTILNEIDEYVKKNFKYRPPSLKDDEVDDADFDEAEIAKQDAKFRAEEAADLESRREALGLAPGEFPEGEMGIDAD